MDDMVNVCGDCILKDLPMCTEIDCIEVENIQRKYTERVRENSVKDFAKFLIDKGIGGFEIPDLVQEFLSEVIK